MASARDVQDMLGMAAGGPVKGPAKKKKRPVETQPKLFGMSREVQALMGDSVPPIAIVETPKYKSKPTLAMRLQRARHWEERGFTPAARSDGLVLKHYKRAIPGPVRPVTDTDMPDAVTFEDDFPMEKWDISIRVPEYTDEQYEKHFAAEDWSKTETDYLMRLASDFDLRWIVIADRYDEREISRPGLEYNERSMEQLKSRYYQIAAADLELKTPKSNMNPQEFALYEKMRTFDAKTESSRKSMAEKLFERTKDEAEEERTLLEELSRITKNEEEFIAMRRDLYARLESAPSLRRNERGEEQNIHLTSQGLGDLLTRLTTKDRIMKRRILETGPSQTPAGGQRPSTASRKDTLETPAENKKASISAPTPKNLSEAEKEKYGVSNPTERLQGGVSFRHEKINRITTAKSQVQTQKLTAALTELGIPARLSMPTEKVCKEFERLVGQIQLLLDARKTLGRVSEEVKILEAMKRERLGEPQPEEAQIDRNTKVVEEMEKAGEIPQPKNMDKTAVNDDDEEDDAEAEDDVEVSKINQVDETIDESVAQTQNDDADDAEVEPDVADADAEADEADEAEEYEDAEAEAEAEAEEEEEDEEEEEEEEEEEDDEDDDEGMIALRNGARNIDADDEDAEPEEDSDDGEADSADEHDVEDSNLEEDVTMNEADPDADAPDVDDAENSRPTSSGSRGHKRGASVVSDASGVGSNRSAVGRKRKR